MRNNRDGLLLFERNIWTVYSTIAVLFVALAILVSWRSYDSDLQAAHAATGNSSLTVSEKVGHVFTLTQDSLHDMAVEILKQGDIKKENEKDYHLLLRSFLTKNSAIAEYALIDDNGALIATSTEYPAPTHTRALDTPIHSTEHSPASVVADTSMQIESVQGIDSDEPLIPVTKRIIDPERKISGILRGLLRVDAFRDFSMEMPGFSSASFSVATSTGHLLVRYPYSKYFFGRNLKIVDHWAKEGYSSEAGTTELEGAFDGSPRVVSYHKVANFPLYAMAAVTKHEVFINWLPHLFLQSLLIISILFVGWLGALFLKRSLSALDLDRTDTIKSYQELCKMLEKTNSKIGEAYFEALTLTVAQTFGLKDVFVAKIMKLQPAAVKTIVHYSNSRFEEPMEYLLENTPCDRVFNRETCFFEKNVQQLFPKDSLLQQMEIQSYLGVPLRDSDGKTIGIFVATDTRPRPDLQRYINIFELFSVRAGAELERLQIKKPQSSSSTAAS